MRAALEIITPSYAKQLLAQNPNNRKVSQRSVDRFALDMVEGRWQQNGQTIVISPSGELLDGQHRMHAIVKADMEIAFLVARNVDKEAFHTIDSGRPRQLADVLHIEGYQYTTTLAGAARAGWNYVSGLNHAYAPSKATLLEFIRNHPDIIEMANKVGKSSTNKSFPRVPLAAIMFLAASSNQYDQEVGEFIDGVTTGVGLWKGDPRHTLREWHMTQRMNDRHDLRSEAIFAATGRAWNAYATGKELHVLKGLVQPTKMSLPIVGFKPVNFPDTPDLTEKVSLIRRENLAKGRDVGNAAQRAQASQKRAESVAP